MDGPTLRRLTAAICTAMLLVAACSDTDGTKPASNSLSEATSSPSGADTPERADDPPAPDPQPRLQTRSERRDEPGPEWMQGRESVPAPWTHVVDAEVARRAVVSTERLRFPESVASELPDLERFDILVSGVPSQSFLRRVERVHREDGELVVETASARLTDALLRGRFDNSDAVRSWRSGQPGDEFDPSPADPGTDGDDSDDAPGPYRQTHQRLRNGEPEYTSLGRYTLGDFDVDEAESLVGPDGVFDELGGDLRVEAEGTPTVAVEPRYWFSMEVDFQSGRDSPSSDHFFSTRECTSDSDCFAGESGGETCLGYDPERFDDLDPNLADKLEEYDPDAGEFTRYCAYTTDGATHVDVREEDGAIGSGVEYQQCGEILEVLDWARSDDGEQCYDDWEPWYNEKGEQGARRPSSCERDNRDALAPYPSQLEWAKLVCNGSLTHAEVDLKSDVDAGVDDFQMDVQGSGSKAWPLVSTGDQIIAGVVFLVGELPVVVTFNYNVTVPFALNIGASVEFNPDQPEYVGMRDVTIPNGGFHYYASHAAYEQGHFGPPTHERPRDYLDNLHFNAIDFDASPDFEAPTVGDSRIEGTATLSVIPEVSLLLYHAAGPYLEPMAPYATVTGSTETDPCQVGVEVGATGAVGLKAQLPFGLGTDELPDAESRGDTPDSSDLVGAARDKIFDFLSNTHDRKWMMYDTCGHDAFPLERFEWDESARSDVNPERMCPEGIDGLCYRNCLYGSCPGDEDSQEGDDSSGDGSSEGGEADGPGAEEGGSIGTDESDVPRPADRAGSSGGEGNDDEGPVAQTFGCTTGGGPTSPAPWLLALVAGAIAAVRQG